MSRAAGREWFSTLSTVVLILCALLVTGMVVRKELFPPRPELEITFYEDWEELLSAGNRLGDSDAPVQMVVFYDYQCPFCRSVEPTIERLRASYGEQLAVTFRHFLLESIHPQARRAALAVECAADQGQFATLHHVLFANASLLGETPWEELAVESGVPDVDAFSTCLTEQRHNDRIARDGAAVAALGISSIPGIVINGQVVTGAKPFDVLDGLVRQALNAS